MITINDEQRLLNLNHMAIYLLLSSDEEIRYGEKLKGLNRYTSLTRGLFHFDIVIKGENPYEALPKDMIRNMRHFNVMVRLVNSIHGIYCYGMEEIDFDAEMSSIIDELKMFVDSVCKEDIKQLDILNERSTSSSMAAFKVYRENNIVKDVFEAALTGGNTDAARAKALLESSSHSSDMATSLGLAFAATDDKQASKIEKERCERERPFERPDIYVTITKVRTGRKPRRNGEEKIGWGFDVSVDGEHLPVYFGSNDQTFFYAALLLANIDGIALRRRNFQSVANAADANWLCEKYKYFDFSTDFTDWYNTIKKSEAHRIDDAISKIKNALWEILKDNYKNAYYYLCIITEAPRTNSTHYKIRLSSRRIKLDQL